MVKVFEKRLFYIYGAGGLLLPGLAWLCFLLFHRLPMGPLQSFTEFYLFFLCAFCAVTDIWNGHIYNAVVYPAIIFLLGAAFITEYTTKGYLYLGENILFAEALTGSFVCFLLTLIPYLGAYGGAGDVKLATVLGAGLGLTDGIFALGGAFVVTALLGVFVIFGKDWKKVFTREKKTKVERDEKMSDSNQKEDTLWKQRLVLPFAPGIFIMIILIYFYHFTL